jgi:hypothetical protein
MHRLLPTLAVVALLVTGCGAHDVVTVTPPPTLSTCAPPAGGRCAGNVAWRGPMTVTPDGRTLTGVVLCGGTFHATESRDRVMLRLHVGAIGPGAMLCARVDVRVTLARPLGGRRVYDAVSGDLVRIRRMSG